MVAIGAGMSKCIPGTQTQTQTQTDRQTDRHTHTHTQFYKGFNLTVPDKFKCLPYFHWLPKLHKTPYASRLIASSSGCTTTLISEILTACLGLVRKWQQVYYEAIYRNSSIKGYWMLSSPMSSSIKGSI